MSKNKTHRFVATTGAPITNEEAAQYGPILEQIAHSLRVNGLSNLDKRQLYEIVEADKKHPLRAFVFNCDDGGAARQYRIERCGVLLRSIRYADADHLNRLVKSVSAKKKMFFRSDAPVVEQGSGKTRTTSVLRDDLLRHDPAYISAVSYQVRQIRNAFAQLEDLGTARTPPRGIANLIGALRASLDAYEAEIQDVAAE